MDRDEYFQQEKTKILKIIEDILNNQNVIYGVREIIKFKSNFSIENEEKFSFFKGVYSNTDEHPIGKVRENWNQESLKKLDVEINEYFSKIEGNLKRESRNLKEYILQFKNYKDSPS
jgi:hypothetical protein